MNRSDDSINKIIRAYCIRNPILFLETELGIKLNWFQKLLIKIAFMWGTKDAKSK